MADKVLPIIFINLSGEMIYVIQQRLEAQNISPDKSSRVMQDIICTMLNDQFIEELFKPQKMYSRSAMQSVFEKLVHSSIMRLNSNSMGKLYDLMLMVFKYQVVNCRHPEDIFLVTLNHLDAVKNYTKSYPDLFKKIENLHSLLISNYKGMSHEEYECVYNCVNVFLQDLNIRVSVLMKLGLQLPNGEIVRPKLETNEELDGIKTLTLKEDVSSLAAGNKTKNIFPPHSLDLDGDRGLTLGTNIYVKSTLMQPSKKNVSQPVPVEVAVESSDTFEALEELTLLGRLIGKCNQSDIVPEITLVSTEDEMEDMYGATIKDNCCFVNIDASQTCQQELSRISKELLVKEEEKGSDILELLDIAENKSS